MLVILTRTILIFLLLLLGLRLMGKRQIGELQPFEFVITLAVAELACTPMQDNSIPLVYGLIPVLTVFVLHYFMTLLSTKSVRFRKVLNGKPMIVVDRDGINSENLKKLNMNVNDLLESIRNAGYFSVEQVAYAIVETNGNVSVLEREGAPVPQSVPVGLIVEGRHIDCNFSVCGRKKEEIDAYLNRKGLNVKDIVLLTTEGKKLFVQPKEGAFFVEEVGV